MKFIVQAITAAAIILAALPAAGAEAKPADPPAQEAPAAMPPARGRALIDHLAADNPEEAIAAADELADAGKSILPMLAEAAPAENETLRLRVAGVLGRIIDPQAMDLLCEMLADASHNVRREAIGAVGNHEREESVEQLEGFLLDKNPLLRREAVMALGRIGCKAALPAVRRSCLDDDHRVRKAAVVALSLLDDDHDAAVPILISRLRDENKAVRKMAHLILKTMCDTPLEYNPDDDRDKRNEAANLCETWWKTYNKGAARRNTRKKPEDEK
jgi:HEAT repeat protein